MSSKGKTKKAGKKFSSKKTNEDGKRAGNRKGHGEFRPTTRPESIRIICRSTESEKTTSGVLRDPPSPADVPDQGLQFMTKSADPPHRLQSQVVSKAAEPPHQCLQLAALTTRRKRQEHLLRVIRQEHLLRVHIQATR